MGRLCAGAQDFRGAPGTHSTSSAATWAWRRASRVGRQGRTRWQPTRLWTAQFRRHGSLGMTTPTHGREPRSSTQPSAARAVRVDPRTCPQRLPRQVWTTCQRRCTPCTGAADPAGRDRRGDQFLRCSHANIASAPDRAPHADGQPLAPTEVIMTTVRPSTQPPSESSRRRRAYADGTGSRPSTSRCEPTTVSCSPSRRPPSDSASDRSFHVRTHRRRASPVPTSRTTTPHPRRRPGRIRRPHRGVHHGVTGVARTIASRPSTKPTPLLAPSETRAPYADAITLRTCSLNVGGEFRGRPVPLARNDRPGSTPRRPTSACGRCGFEPTTP